MSAASPKHVDCESRLSTASKEVEEETGGRSLSFVRYIDLS
jgi:hypothetical protein